MTKQATTTQRPNILAVFTPEQLAAFSPEQLAALAAVSIPAAMDAPEAPEAPKAPKAPKGKKASGKKNAPAVTLHSGQWASYRDADGAARMCKLVACDDGIYVKVADGLMHASEAAEIEAHETQGQALQRRNALSKQGPKPEAAPAPKPEAAPEAPADLDERAARIAAKNAAIIATAPEANRRIITNKLAQAHKAGYPYARLARNKHHQLDGLHLYPGQKGHGRDKAFKALVTKAGEKYRAKADEAAAQGKKGSDAPKPPARTWFWSPVGGGNLYVRGIFGDVSND